MEFSLKYYFLTFDYANTSNGYPTKEDYYNIISFQFKKFNISLTDEIYPVKCFEFKHKSNKYPNWLHWHGIIQTYKYIPFKNAQCQNWSIKYVRITTLKKLAFYAGYIQKNKVDYVDLPSYNNMGEH